MGEYVYKGFKVHYDIKKSKLENGLYRANAYVVCYIHPEGPDLTQKFQTEAPTKTNVRHEIKKNINKYIDFEWEQFLKMKGAI